MKPLGKDPQGKAGRGSKRIRGSGPRNTVRFVMVSSHWVTDKLSIHRHMRVSLCFLLTQQYISWGNWSMCLSSSTQNQTSQFLEVVREPSQLCSSQQAPLPEVSCDLNGQNQPQGTAHTAEGEGSGLCLCGKNIRVKKSWDVKTARYEKHTHHIPAFKDI